MIIWAQILVIGSLSGYKQHCQACSEWMDSKLISVCHCTKQDEEAGLLLLYVCQDWLDRQMPPKLGLSLLSFPGCLLGIAMWALVSCCSGFVSWGHTHAPRHASVYCDVRWRGTGKGNVERDLSLDGHQAWAWGCGVMCSPLLPALPAGSPAKHPSSRRCFPGSAELG